MQSTLGIRNLNLRFIKIKRPESAESSSPSNPEEEDQSRPPPLPNSAASTLIKNFNSLYDLAFDSTSNSNSLARFSFDDLSSDSDSGTKPTTPDFAAIFASQRFFFASPGRSNSIVDSSSPSSSSSSQVDQPESDTLVGGNIAVPTVSPDPYNDFRRSMQEMVEARDLVDVRANWDYLHELFRCYLALNPKSTHKFIGGAFADLLLNNFNSLYDLAFDSTSNSNSLARFSSNSDSGTEPTTPDFSAVFASQRFFFAPPGQSNSIVDSSLPSSSSSAQVDPPESDTLVGGSIAVWTVSPDPYNDFRRSMQEMVEALDLVDVRANWDYWHELLRCYLTLNPKSTHKFIVRAFADLLLSLMTFPTKSSGDRESEFSGGDCSISRRCM